MEGHFFNWECRGVAGAIFVYLVHFLFLPRAALDVLFNQALPIYTNGVASFASSIICGLTLDWAFYLPIYFMVVLLIFSSVLARQSRWIIPITALVLISFVIYLQSGTVWTYRMLPLQAFLDVLFALQLGVVIDLFLRYAVNQKIASGLGKITPFVLLFASVFYGMSEARAYNNDIKGLNKFALSAIGYSGTNPTNDLDAVFFTLLKHTTKDDRVVPYGACGFARLPGHSSGWATAWQSLFTWHGFAYVALLHSKLSGQKICTTGKNCRAKLWSGHFEKQTKTCFDIAGIYQDHSWINMNLSRLICRITNR